MESLMFSNINDDLHYHHQHQKHNYYQHQHQKHHHRHHHQHHHHHHHHLPKYNYETTMGRSFCVSTPTNWNKLPTKLCCEIIYNIFRRKVKFFYFININIVLYLFI